MPSSRSALRRSYCDATPKKPARNNYPLTMPRKEANRQGEGSKRTTDIFFSVSGFYVAALMARGGALAEDHLGKAISHTKEAIDHGKMRNPHVFVAHAEEALTHREAATK